MSIASYILHKPGKVAVILVIVLYFLAMIIPYAPVFERRSGPNPVGKEALTWSPEPGPPGAHEARVISAPQDALNVRLALIQEAEATIDIAYYAISNDRAGQAFLHELFQAADRGVEIRILLDAKLGALSRPHYKALASHPKIRFSRYNRFNLFTPWRHNESLHDKFLIVDGHLTLLGGRNIHREHYLPEANGHILKHDWDVLVRSEGDWELNRYYEELWQHPRSAEVKASANWLGQRRDARVRARVSEEAERFRRDFPEYYSRTLADYTVELLPTERILLLHNPLNQGRKAPWVAESLHQLASQATESVYVQTPYATATDDLLVELAVPTEAEIYYLTNSPGSTPNIFAFPNYYYQRDEFLETGMRIYEYQSQDSIHGKAYLIDEKISAIGSFNLDSRSRHINTEVMLVIDSVEFAESFKEHSTQLILQSLEVGPDNEYLPSDTVEEAEVPLVKRGIMRLFYLLFRPLQFFL